jgi:polyhydroxyalkanoate synthesis regulator phasin
MISPQLHQFIDNLMAKGSITAEDVKHLHRDLLPNGILS